MIMHSHLAQKYMILKLWKHLRYHDTLTIQVLMLSANT